MKIKKKTNRHHNSNNNANNTNPHHKYSDDNDNKDYSIYQLVKKQTRESSPLMMTSRDCSADNPAYIENISLFRNEFFPLYLFKY